MRFPYTTAFSGKALKTDCFQIFNTSIKFKLWCKTSVWVAHTSHFHGFVALNFNCIVVGKFRD